MKAGDTIEVIAKLTDNVGALASYANLTAFTSAGWALVFTVDQIAATPVYTVTDLGSGVHSFKWTAIEGDYRALVTIPAAHSASALGWTIYVDSVDLSDIYSAVNSGGDLTPITQSLGDQSLGNIIDNDSWATGDLTVPLSRLSPYGYTDLTGMTITAYFRKDPSGTPVAVTAAIEDAANRLVSASFITFPAAMNLGATATDLRETWYLDIQLIHTASGRKITAARYSVDVLWERDET